MMVARTVDNRNSDGCFRLCRYLTGMEVRPYEHGNDFAAVQRIWREVGWIDSDDSAKAMEHFVADSNGLVATIDEDPESFVMRSPGKIRYQDSDLDLSVVAAVTTSLIGRKKGFASRLTAQILAEAREDGAAVSILGMFEQGFYDLLGFGSGSYEHHLTFDPSSLRVDVPYRTPIRLSEDDWEAMHRALLNRKRAHGGVLLEAPGMTRSELGWASPSFGFGYRGDDGEITHFVYGTTKGEHGPYRVGFFAYQNTDQLLELLKLIQVLGDQVRAITLTEPPEIQLQDLFTHVFRQRISTRKSEFEARHSSGTWWQLRVLDLPTTVAARRHDGEPVKFVAEIHDPLHDMLDGPWRGEGGSYVIEIGDTSKAVPGDQPDLPVLKASINAFSRMWFGVRPATSLAVTNELAADPQLLSHLDRALALPTPHPGIYF